MKLKQGNYWRKPTGKEKWKAIAETGVLAFQERSQLSPRCL
jgi:predicted RNA-binding protein